MNQEQIDDIVKHAKVTEYRDTNWAGKLVTKRSKECPFCYGSYNNLRQHLEKGACSHRA